MPSRGLCGRHERAFPTRIQQIVRVQALVVPEEGLQPPDSAVAALGGTLDRRAYPPAYLKREREGWRE